VIQDVNSAFLPDQSLLNFSTSAQLLHGCSVAHDSPAYAVILSRPVYESSFFTSKEIYETSDSRRSHDDYRTHSEDTG